MRIEHTASVIVINEIRFLMEHGQMEVARSEPWYLFHCPRDTDFDCYRLYVDIPDARRYQWRLYAQKGGEIEERSDALALRREHPDVLRWAAEITALPDGADMSGIDPPIYDADAITGPRITHAKPVFEPLTGDQRQAVLSLIKLAWNDGRPLSTYSGTKPYGRYAPDVIEQACGYKPSATRAAIGQMLEDGIVKMEMYNSRTKMRGLRVC